MKKVVIKIIDSCCGGSYSKSLRKINNLEVLKILDTQEDISLREQKDVIKSFIFLFLFGIFISFAFMILPKFLYGNLCLLFVYLVILLNIIVSAYFWFGRLIYSGLPLLMNRFPSVKLQNRLILVRRYFFVIILIMLPFLLSAVFLFLKQNERYILERYKLAFLFYLLISCIIFYINFRSFKKWATYQLEMIMTNAAFLLLLISLTNMLLGILPGTSDPFAKTFIFLATLLATILKICIIDHECKKNQLRAQNIFQTQLLSTAPNYKELKKCYYHGGEKYKEKMLSAEKFLKVILWNEESSFYTWKSYENYLEYKNYRYKQFRKNSKEGYLTNV